jgi:hypothetical protein
MVLGLIIAAWLALAGGFLALGQASQGIGVIGLACFLAIMARIAQAQDHHREEMALLRGLHHSAPP